MAKKKEKKYKVLVAEDVSQQSRALEIKLGAAGFDVTVVANGDEAIRKLKESDFDLLLLDILMPEVSGFDVLRILIRQNNLVPVVVLSNMADDQQINTAHDLGAKDYLVKANTSLATVVDKIKDILSRQ